MKLSAKIAAVLATFATTFAVGCAAPGDATAEGSPVAEQPSAPVVDDPGFDGRDDDAMYPFQGYDVDANTIRLDLADYVLGKLKDHSWAMMLNKIGLDRGTSGDLEEVLKQLQQIKEQLARTHNELQASIAKATLNAKVTATIEDMATIRLTLERYENIARIEKEIALARERGDADAVAKLSFGIEDRVQEFVNMFDAGGRMALAIERLHLTIAGTGFGEENLIDLYRWQLRSSSRNLTNAHSQSLATGLAFFEEYEAVAALLTAECNAAVQYGHDGSGKWPKVTSKTCSRDPRANDRLSDKMELYVGEQRAKMPPVIPPGMLIDQGTTFGGINDTTINKPIFLSIDGGYTFRSTDTATTPGSVRQAVANLQVVGGADWRLPAEPDLRVLFNGNRSGETTRVHLNRVFGTNGKFANQDFIWTTNTRGQLVQYNGGGGGQHVNVTTFTGTLIDGQFIVRNDPRPHFPMNTQPNRERTEEMINQMFATTRGGIIVLGNTGPTNYM